MRRINVSEFKARCLALVDEVASTGEPLEILKRGKPMARLIRTAAAGAEYPQKALKGKGRALGDIVGPAAAPEDWDANRE